MANQHKNPAKTFRPDPPEHQDVMDLLPEGRTMDGMLRACLRWVRANPDQALETLAPYWPPKKPLGRPPSNAKPGE